MTMSRNAIMATMTARTTSMMSRIREYYARSGVLGVKLSRRIDWGWKGYQLNGYAGEDSTRWDAWLLSFGLMKVIKQPVEGGTYLPREHYHGFTFTMLVSWGDSAALRMGVMYRGRLQLITLFPLVRLYLYV